MKATLILHRELEILDGKFVVKIRVYAVEKTKKFPQGIKAKCLLQYSDNGMARLLVDRD